MTRVFPIAAFCAASLVVAAPAAALACAAHAAGHEIDHQAGHGVATPLRLAQAGGHGAGHGAGPAPEAGPAVVGDIAVTGAYVRANPAGRGASAAYMTLSTTGAADRLVAASSPAAERVELHTHTLDDAGVARMRRVEAIAVEPGADTALAPGGLHVMLMGLTAPLQPGGTAELTLSFESAGDVTLTVPVRAVSGHGGHGGHGAGVGN